MTDTTAPAPTWLQVLQGFLPSLNQAIVIVVTAVVTFASTLGMQWLTAPKLEIHAADAPVPLHRQIDLAVNRLDGRITEALGVAGLCVDELQALRKDFRTPRAASPAKAATK